MDLNLTNQQSEYDKIAPRIATLRSWMDQRKPIWGRLTYDQKRLWITSGKDPIMTLAWNTYRYLRDNFFDQGVDNG
jgi:hypothetical protein